MTKSEGGWVKKRGGQSRSSFKKVPLPEAREERRGNGNRSWGRKIGAKENGKKEKKSHLFRGIPYSGEIQQRLRRDASGKKGDPYTSYGKKAIARKGDVFISLRRELVKGNSGKRGRIYSGIQNVVLTHGNR